MQWGSWAEFWAMGGKGLYVWGSFAVTFIVLGAELWLLRVRSRALTAQAED